MMKYLKPCTVCQQNAGYHSIYRTLWETLRGGLTKAHGFKIEA